MYMRGTLGGYEHRNIKKKLANKAISQKNRQILQYFNTELKLNVIYQNHYSWTRIKQLIIC